MSHQLQTQALGRSLKAGLLNPFSGMNSSVRFGEIAQTLLSRWPIAPLRPKPLQSEFRYLTIGGRIHWLMLRESLHSLVKTWRSIPEIVVVSDGSWSARDFEATFSWWPGPLSVISKEEVCRHADELGLEKLAKYASSSPYGLKLAAIVTEAIRKPVLFVDADILWFRDPHELLGEPTGWGSPKGIRESQCYQREDLAKLHCPEALEPPFVNGGILALHGTFLEPAILNAMVTEALTDPMDGTYEQTIIATAVKTGSGLFPEKLCLVEFDDVSRMLHRNMDQEGFFSRHYVNWMRHLLYRDALNLRLRFRKVVKM